MKCALSTWSGRAFIVVSQCSISKGPRGLCLPKSADFLSLVVDYSMVV